MYKVITIFIEEEVLKDASVLLVIIEISLKYIQRSQKICLRFVKFVTISNS